MRGLQVVAAGDTNDISSKTCSEPPCLLDRYTRFVPPFDSSVPVGAKQIAVKFFFFLEKSRENIGGRRSIPNASTKFSHIVYARGNDSLKYFIDRILSLSVDKPRCEMGK